MLIYYPYSEKTARVGEEPIGLIQAGEIYGNDFQPKATAAAEAKTKA